MVESLSNLVSKQTVDQLSEGKWLNNTVKIKENEKSSKLLLPMCTNMLNSVT